MESDKLSPVVVVGIDLNTASATELQQLPKIGERLAGRIVSDRDQNGPFSSLEELETRVKRIGPSHVEAIRSLDTLQAVSLHSYRVLSWLRDAMGSLLIGTVAGIVASLLVWYIFLAPAAEETRQETLNIQKTTLETLTAFTSARLNALACREKWGDAAIAELNQFLQEQWDAFLEETEVTDIEAIRDSLYSELLESKAPGCDPFVDVGPLPIDIRTGTA